MKIDFNFDSAALSGGLRFATVHTLNGCNSRALFQNIHLLIEWLSINVIRNKTLILNQCNQSKQRFSNIII